MDRSHKSICCTHAAMHGISRLAEEMLHTILAADCGETYPCVPLFLRCISPAARSHLTAIPPARRTRPLLEPDRFLFTLAG